MSPSHPPPRPRPAVAPNPRPPFLATWPFPGLTAYVGSEVNSEAGTDTKPAPKPSPRVPLTAIIKGAGPAGLAAAIAIAQSWRTETRATSLQPKVVVVEKRRARGVGEGRVNITAIRAEAQRDLEQLGALEWLTRGDHLTYILPGNTPDAVLGEDGTPVSKIVSDWTTRGPDGQKPVPMDVIGDEVVLWPIIPWNKNMRCVTQAEAEAEREAMVAESVSEQSQNPSADLNNAAEQIYVIPDKISSQLPNSLVFLGTLEDALMASAKNLGVEIVNDASFSLTKGVHADGDDEGNAYAATLTTNLSWPESERLTIPLGTPDLVVLASGKADMSYHSELALKRYTGAEFTQAALPTALSTQLNLASSLANDESTLYGLETQQHSCFGVRLPPTLRPPPPMGLFSLTISKALPSNTVRGCFPGAGAEWPIMQPIFEIITTHKDVAHMQLQVPRFFANGAAVDSEEYKSKLEAYILARFNFHAKTDFKSTREMYIMWGDPIKPVTVESCTVSQFSVGDNVILTGDAGTSCSPSSGIGADLATSQNATLVRRLAEEIKRAADIKVVGTGLGPDQLAPVPETIRLVQGWKKDIKRIALAEFNRNKAVAGWIWADASRQNYLTREQAQAIRASMAATAVATAPTTTSLPSPTSTSASSSDTAVEAGAEVPSLPEGAVAKTIGQIAPGANAAATAV